MFTIILIGDSLEGRRGKKTPKTFLSPSNTSGMKGFDSTLFFFSRRKKKKKSFHILNSKSGIHHFFLLQFLCLGPEQEALHLCIFFGWLVVVIYTFTTETSCALCALHFFMPAQTLPVQYTAHRAVDCTTVERGQKLYQGCTTHCNIQTASQVLLEML